MNLGRRFFRRLHHEPTSTRSAYWRLFSLSQKLASASSSANITSTAAFSRLSKEIANSWTFSASRIPKEHYRSSLAAATEVIQSSPLLCWMLLCLWPPRGRANNSAVGCATTPWTRRFQTFVAFNAFLLRPLLPHLDLLHWYVRTCRLHSCHLLQQRP